MNEHNRQYLKNAPTTKKNDNAHDDDLLDHDDDLLDHDDDLLDHDDDLLDYNDFTDKDNDERSIINVNVQNKGLEKLWHAILDWCVLMVPVIMSLLILASIIVFIWGVVSGIKS